MIRVRGVVTAICLFVLAGGTVVGAASFSSSNFTINGTAGDSIAGSQSSTNYKMTSAGGGSVAGDGSSGSYKLPQGYSSQLEKSLQLNIQPTGLVVNYTFDDPVSRSVPDYGPYGRTAKTFGTPSSTTGKIGNAIATADNKSAQVDDTTGFDNGNLTVMAWLKATDWSTEINGIAVGRWGSTVIPGNYHLGMNGAAQFRFGVYASGGAQTNIVSSASTAGVWYHVVGTYDGTTMRFYRNGVQQSTSTAQSGAIPAAATPFTVGERPNTGDPYWNGAVDEVKVFDRALSPEEIVAEYNAQNSGIVTGLTLTDITAGVSKTRNFDLVTQTDAPGYNLSINQDNNLTNGSDNIAGVSGSIASPVAWSEGSTKGLGFSLYGTNATAIPGTWNSGNSYAALPASATSFYTRTGYTGGARDVLNMRLRLDTTANQGVGDYTNQMIMTGTMTP